MLTLYNSRRENWCERERRQQEIKAAGRRSAAVQQEYDQDKFEELVQTAIANGIMADVSHDRDQLDHLASHFISRLADHADSL